MNILVDSSMIGRLSNTRDPDFNTAQRALRNLEGRGERLHITAQVLIEFRNFGTRPASSNGLGLQVATVEGLAALYESRFPLLPDEPDIFDAWKHVVHTLGVEGKQVHDARLVAVCQVHGIDRVVTFNVGHFARLVTAVPGLAVLDPATVP